MRIPRLEWSRLQALTRRRHAQHDVVVRAWAIVWLSHGHGPTRVALLVGRSARVVRKWRARWEDCPCIESLLDAARSGRPPRVSLETRCEIVQLACERPAENRAAFRDVWSYQAVADALHECTGERVSRSTVRRILGAAGYRPHRVRYGNKGLVGEVFHRNILLIEAEKKGAVPLRALLNSLEAEARAAGAVRLEITGHAVVNAGFTPAVANRLGYAFRQINPQTIELTKVLR